LRLHFPTPIRQRLQARGYVDAITVEVAALHHDIAQVDPYAQHDPNVLCQASVGGPHGVLQLDGAFDGVDGAGKFNQHPVAHHLDDPPAMFRDKGLENFTGTALRRASRL
jgi:hypothetical protein